MQAGFLKAQEPDGFAIMTIRLKRIYDPRTPADGLRVLVDRLWPRGVKKSEAGLSLWLKEIAPSPELRRWFDHKPERWQEFRKKYLRELAGNTEAVIKLNELAQSGTVTLLYAAKDRMHNHARVIADYLAQNDQLHQQRK